MVSTIIRAEIRIIKNELEKLYKKFHIHFPKIAHKSVLTIILNTTKITFSMGQLSVVTGTPVTGSAAPKAADGTILPLSAYKVGSCKWSVADGAGFTIAPGDIEEDFVITETTPGSASTGQVNFDAQDVNGDQLPTASFTLSFTVAVPPPPPLAVGSQITANGQVVA